MRILLACLAVLVLLGLHGCARPDTQEIIRAGMEKRAVRAALERHGAQRINDVVRSDPIPTEDWYVQSQTCMLLTYDVNLKLMDIVIGSSRRGWKDAHDWGLQVKTTVKQLYLE